MVPADDQRGRDLAAAHQVVEQETGPVPFPVTKPADPGGESLELDSLRRQRQPTLKQTIVAELLLEGLVCCVDVGRLTGQRHPAKRALAFAEEGAEVGRDKPGEGE